LKTRKPISGPGWSKIRVKAGGKGIMRRGKGWSLPGLRSERATELFEAQLNRETVRWITISKRPRRVRDIYNHLLRGVRKRAKVGGIPFSMEEKHVVVDGDRISIEDIGRFCDEKLMPGLEGKGLVTEPVKFRDWKTAMYLKHWVGRAWEKKIESTEAMETLIEFKKRRDMTDPFFLIGTAALKAEKIAKKTADRRERRAIAKHFVHVLKDLWSSKNPLEYHEITKKIREGVEKDKVITHEYTGREIARAFGKTQKLLLNNKVLTMGSLYTTDLGSAAETQAFVGPEGVDNLNKLMRERGGNKRGILITRAAKNRKEPVKPEDEEIVTNALKDILGKIEKSNKAWESSQIVDEFEKRLARDKWSLKGDYGRSGYSRIVDGAVISMMEHGLLVEEKVLSTDPRAGFVARAFAASREEAKAALENLARERNENPKETLIDRMGNIARNEKVASLIRECLREGKPITERLLAESCGIGGEVAHIVVRTGLGVEGLDGRMVNLYVSGEIIRRGKTKGEIHYAPREILVRFARARNARLRGVTIRLSKGEKKIVEGIIDEIVNEKVLKKKKTVELYNVVDFVRSRLQKAGLGNIPYHMSNKWTGQTLDAAVRNGKLVGVGVLTAKGKAAVTRAYVNAELLGKERAGNIAGNIAKRRNTPITRLERAARRLGDWKGALKYLREMSKRDVAFTLSNLEKFGVEDERTLESVCNILTLPERLKNPGKRGEYIKPPFSKTTTTSDAGKKMIVLGTENAIRQFRRDGEPVIIDEKPMKPYSERLKEIEARRKARWKGVEKVEEGKKEPTEEKPPGVGRGERPEGAPKPTKKVEAGDLDFYVDEAVRSMGVIMDTVPKEGDWAGKKGKKRQGWADTVRWTVRGVLGTAANSSEPLTYERIVESLRNGIRGIGGESVGVETETERKMFAENPLDYLKGKNIISADVKSEEDILNPALEYLVKNGVLEARKGFFVSEGESPKTTIYKGVMVPADEFERLCGENEKNRDDILAEWFFRGTGKHKLARGEIKEFFKNVLEANETLKLGEVVKRFNLSEGRVKELLDVLVSEGILEKGITTEKEVAYGTEEALKEVNLLGEEEIVKLAVLGKASGGITKDKKMAERIIEFFERVLKDEGAFTREYFMRMFGTGREMTDTVTRNLNILVEAGIFKRWTMRKPGVKKVLWISYGTEAGIERKKKERKVIQKAAKMVGVSIDELFDYIERVLREGEQVTLTDIADGLRVEGEMRKQVFEAFNTLCDAGILKAGIAVRDGNKFRVYGAPDVV
jgi:hypothetical protein